jgi:Tfp pilus assembly protein PilV
MSKILKNYMQPNRLAKFYGRGFMMVEVIVVAAIITVSVLAAMAVAQKSVHVSFKASHLLQAGFLLEEGAEVVRIVRDNAWSNISNLTAGTNYYPTFTGGTWTLSATANTVGIFTRTVVFSDVNRDATSQDIVSVGGVLDTKTKLVTVSVSWQEGGVVTVKTLQFYISDIFS